MTRKHMFIGLVSVALGLASCQGGGGKTGAGSGAAGTAVPDPPAPATADGGRPLVFIDGQPLASSELTAYLVEAYGGQILSEIVVEKRVRDRLQQRGITIDAGALEEERRIMLRSLAADDDTAQRMLGEMRTRRGWGDRRYRSLLFRNAGLRALVKDEIRVDEPAIRKEYDRQYGPRYDTRLIVAADARTASDLAKRARAGENFMDLAMRYSTDVSRDQGGYLGSISLDDDTYPLAVRQALGRMEIGGVSDPVALDKGFAVLKLERKKDAQNVRYDDVKSELALDVRRRAERTAMQRIAKEMVTQTDIVINDPGLKQSWDEQRKVLLTPE